MSTQNLRRNQIRRALHNNPNLKNYLSTEQQDLLRKQKMIGNFVGLTGILSVPGAYFVDRETNIIRKFVCGSRFGRYLTIFGAVPFITVSVENFLFKSRSAKKLSISVSESLNSNPEFKEAFESSLNKKSKN